VVKRVLLYNPPLQQSLTLNILINDQSVRSLISGGSRRSYGKFSHCMFSKESPATVATVAMENIPECSASSVRSRSSRNLFYPVAILKTGSPTIRLTFAGVIVPIICCNCRDHKETSLLKSFKFLLLAQIGSLPC